ncbi:unnamed protein product [Protopolystoma xenopodis]|uniref:LRRNT domain-containing protein n=1 Tax=Protopolystoma xenopodis TaxID=117903 RepID=A0A448WPV4_9PLAT|nr:unnamed protein product [Protopolystoma xenopodis]
MFPLLYSLAVAYILLICVAPHLCLENIETCPEFCECKGISPLKYIDLVSPDTEDHTKIKNTDSRENAIKIPEAFKVGIGIENVAANCHVTPKDLPLNCPKSWRYLRILLTYKEASFLATDQTHYMSNINTVSEKITRITTPFLMQCSQLTSFVVTSLIERDLVVAVPQILHSLSNLKRVWIRHLQFAKHVRKRISLFIDTPRLEFAAISFSNLQMAEATKVLDGAPATLRQLRLNNLEISGRLSPKLCSHICQKEESTNSTKGIISLYLNENRISGLYPESFENCSQLKVLHLAGNELQGSLESVVGMMLPGQSIEYKSLGSMHPLNEVLLASAFVHIPQLTILDLSGNKISSIQTPLWSGARIEKETLKLRGGLVYLHRLSLSNNKLHFISPGAFAGLPGLRELDLTRNPTLVSPPVYTSRNLIANVNGFDPSVLSGMLLLTRLSWDRQLIACLSRPVMNSFEYGSLSASVFRELKRLPLCSNQTKFRLRESRQTNRMGSIVINQDLKYATKGHFGVEKPYNTTNRRSNVSDYLGQNIAVDLFARMLSFGCVCILLLLLFILALLERRFRQHKQMKESNTGKKIVLKIHVKQKDDFCDRELRLFRLKVNANKNIPLSKRQGQMCGNMILPYFNSYCVKEDVQPEGVSTKLNCRGLFSSNSELLQSTKQCLHSNTPLTDDELITLQIKDRQNNQPITTMNDRSIKSKVQPTY